MKFFFTVLQTLLNFIALNIIFNRVANIIVPDSPLGALLGAFYWLIILLLSYAIAINFKNK